jgi:hypothetical protein
MSEKTLVVCDLHDSDHPGTRKITIDVCEAGFEVLMSHITGEGPQRIPCDEPGCDFTARSASGLGRHQKSAHGRESQRDRLKAAAANGGEAAAGQVASPALEG